MEKPQLAFYFTFSGETMRRLVVERDGRTPDEFFGHEMTKKTNQEQIA